jgi:hypothetical protein
MFLRSIPTSAVTPSPNRKLEAATCQHSSDHVHASLTASSVPQRHTLYHLGVELESRTFSAGSRLKLGCGDECERLRLHGKGISYVEMR